MLFNFQFKLLLTRVLKSSQLFTLLFQPMSVLSLLKINFFLLPVHLSLLELPPPIYSFPPKFRQKPPLFAVLWPAQLLQALSIFLPGPLLILLVFIFLPAISPHELFFIPIFGFSLPLFPPVFYFSLLKYVRVTAVLIKFIHSFCLLLLLSKLSLPLLLAFLLKAVLTELFFPVIIPIIFAAFLPRLPLQLSSQPILLAAWLLL